MKLRNFILINSLVIALGISTLFAGFFYYLHTVQKGDVFQNAMKNKGASLEAKYSHLKNKIEKISVWARYFSKDYSVERISINNATPLSFTALEEKAAQMMELSPEVLQFQILGLGGAELFRVDRQNQKIERASSNDLQDHSTWDSFQALKSQSDPKVYVSNFDLKRKEGVIEQPYLPVLQITAPVLIEDNKKAFVMMNVDATAILEDFESDSSESANQSFIINQSGGWMFGHKDFNWSHLFPETEAESFAKYYPITFASMRAGQTGIVSNIEGEFLVRPATLGENTIYFVFHPNLHELLAGQRNLAIQYSLIVAGVFLITFLFSLMVFKLKRNSLLQTFHLKENQSFLKDAEAQAKVGYWNFNFQTQRTYISPQLKGVFGVKEDDRATLEKCLKHFLPESEERIRSAFAKLKSEMKPFDLSERLKTHAGEPLWIRITGNVHEVRQGQVYAAMGLFQDVTQLKENEEATRVTEQSRLENENQIALEEMVKAIYQELNSPISELHSEIAKLESTPNQNSSSIDAVKGALKKLNSINTSLKKLSQDTDSPNYENCSLKQISQEAFNLNSSLLKKSKIEIRNCLKAQDSAPCNSEQILQIFSNLIRNSAQALAAKENAWVEVKAERKHNSLYVYFTDSGSGINEGLQDKIFQSLMNPHQANKVTAHGLHTCKTIMENHGGKLTLDTNNKHTCFVLEFNLKASENNVIELTRNAA
ncbi:PAS domain-containing protein [bacterium]|nr:PAS domain-containing protein [bacterium]